MNFRMRTRGLDEFRDYIGGLARNMRGTATEAISDYLIGWVGAPGSGGLVWYPPYKHIRRRQAYRPPYQSEKQRRFVMASIRSGKIDPGYPHRTGNYQRSWIRLGSGVGSRITGTLPHRGWPNPLARMVGWRAPSEIVKTNIKGAVRYAEQQIVKKKS